MPVGQGGLAAAEDGPKEPEGKRRAMSEPKARGVRSWVRRHCRCGVRPSGDPWMDLEIYDRCAADGERARAAGKSRSACPYPSGTPEHRGWMDGYEGD
jgi:hypothetical protein